MEKEISIKKFIRAIERLPEDERIKSSRVWYESQKEHWLGWLDAYDTAGAYGRKTGVKRTAKFAYNHIVNPGMLVYLARAIPLAPEVVTAVEEANRTPGSMMARAGAIRKVAPWTMIYEALWGQEVEPPPTLLERLKKKVRPAR